MPAGDAHSPHLTSRTDTNGPVDDDAPFYRTLVERSPFMYLVFDVTGTVTYVSPAVVGMAGVTPEQGLGTNIVDYVETDELTSTAEALVYKVAHPDEPFRPFEIHFRGFERQRTCEVVGSPGTVFENIAVLVRDRTRRARLQDILDSVMRSEPIDLTLRAIAGLASEHLRHGGVAVHYDLGGDVPGGLVTYDLEDELAARFDDTDATSPWLRAAASGHAVFGGPDDFGPELRRATETVGRAGCWSAPLRGPEGQSAGTLTVFTADDVAPAPAERDFLRKLSRTAWFALDRWSRDRAVAYAASHDALTGVGNRTMFVDEVARALAPGVPGVPGGHGADATAEAGDTYLLSIDLDGFKAINDRYGHLTGDGVLVTVAERVRAVVRDVDLVARIGGDEFAVLCPAIRSTDEATTIAERVVRALEQPIPVPGATVMVGASVGVASTRGAPRPVTAAVDGLFARADAAMYAAKAAGKGCWIVAGDRPGARP